MTSFSDSDATLHQIYAELERVLGGYSASCEAVERAEREKFDSVSIQAARLRQQSTGMEWRLVVRKMTRITPRTKRGSLAKNRALCLCFKHHFTEDGDVMDLARSHIADLSSFLDEDNEPAMPEPPMVSSRQTTC